MNVVQQGQCFVDRAVLQAVPAVCRRQEQCRQELVSSTRALLEGVPIPCNPQEHCGIDWGIVLSASALFCRQEHSFGGRGTVLSQSDKSIVLAAGALFCQQEHGLVDRSNAMSTGA